MKSKSGFHYSDGNTKMGKIPSFSVMPGITCAQGIPCEKKCYARRFLRYRKETLKGYEHNTRLLMDCKMYDEFVKETVDLINFIGAKTFRFNVGGDFFCKEYLIAALEIAKKCPDTEFWAFTKQWKTVMDTMKEYEDWPDNFTLILSHWGTYVSPEELTEKFGICWFGDKEGQFEIPDDAYVCPGKCTPCMKCVKLKAGDNIVIKQH